MQAIFDAGTAERYGWDQPGIPDAELDAFVADFVGRVLSFDRQAVTSAAYDFEHPSRGRKVPSNGRNRAVTRFPKLPELDSNQRPAD